MIKLNEQRVNVGIRVDHFPLRVDDGQAAADGRWRLEAATGSVLLTTRFAATTRDFRGKRKSVANFVRGIKGIFEGVACLKRGPTKTSRI